MHPDTRYELGRRPGGDFGAWSARGVRRRRQGVEQICIPNVSVLRDRAGYRDVRVPRSGKLPKPSNGLEPLTPSLPWSSRSMTAPPRVASSAEISQISQMQPSATQIHQLVPPMCPHAPNSRGRCRKQIQTTLGSQIHSRCEWRLAHVAPADPTGRRTIGIEPAFRFLSVRQERRRSMAAADELGSTGGPTGSD